MLRPAKERISRGTVGSLMRSAEVVPGRGSGGEEEGEQATKTRQKRVYPLDTRPSRHGCHVSAACAGPPHSAPVTSPKLPTMPGGPQRSGVGSPYLPDSIPSPSASHHTPVRLQTRLAPHPPSAVLRVPHPGAVAPQTAPRTAPCKPPAATRRRGPPPPAAAQQLP
jgi:hypothetical protein